MSGEGCWYCGGDAADAEPVEIRLTAPWSIQHGPRGVTYEQACLKVPRCARCYHAHERVITWQGRGVLVSLTVMSALIGLSVATMPGVLTSIQSFLGLAVVAVLLGGAIWAGLWLGDRKGLSEMRAAGIQPIESNMDYPPVRQLLEEGYFLGVPRPV